MQSNNFDGSQLIVSWNRYEQGLMKQHLIKCANSDDIYCFGDPNEVAQLNESLVKHGILPKTYDYNKTNIDQLVSEIKTAIQDNLKQYNGKTFPGAQWYSINNDAETQFLTHFAMAIQDTKKRQTFFPNGSFYFEDKANPNCSKICFNGDQNNYITKAKMKLLSLATQLTRIGLNCKTTINSSNRMRAPANQNEINNQKNIHLIDTNNFLDLDEAIHGNVAKFFNMKNLNIGMDGVQYYKNLYRKLFDFALQKEIQDGEKKGTWKIPEFVIPLGNAWGTNLNNYILKALNEVLGEGWGRKKGKGSYYKGQYKKYISVKIIDDGTWYQHAKQMPNLKNIGIVNYKQSQPLFNDPKREHYMIMAGDHCSFLGNEAMKNGVNGDTTSIFNQGQYNDSSMESANMKTDFFKFYGQDHNCNTGLLNAPKCGFDTKNGAWIMNPLKLEMPQRYLLHCNYQADRFHQMNENQQLQQNYSSKPIITKIPYHLQKNNNKGFGGK